MKFPSPPPSLLQLLLLIAAVTSAAASPSHESEDMLQSLRNYGYTLFTNAISTSDLKYQLLSDTATATATNTTSDAVKFTLFAPIDELLYALDMAADATAYVSTLRYHVVPNGRHTFADLKNLSTPFLDTLLPHYAVLIGKLRDIDVAGDRQSIAVVVDGVRITFPDLYVGSRIAVHGIDGILLTGLNMSIDHLPPAESPGSPSVSVVPTAAPVNVNGNIPPDGAPTNWNHIPSSAPAAKGISSAAPALQIDRSNIPVGAPVEGGFPTTPWSRIDGNIPAIGPSTTSQDQMEKMKRLEAKRKQKKKSQQKEQRRRRRWRHGGDM